MSVDGVDLGKPAYFTLKEEHLKLLKRTYVKRDDDYNNTALVNPKRPYGNSYVEGDVREILGIDSNQCPHCGEHIETDEDKNIEANAMKFHMEMPLAMQVIFSVQSFELGEYVNRDYYHGTAHWEKV